MGITTLFKCFSFRSLAEGPRCAACRAAVQGLPHLAASCVPVRPVSAVLGNDVTEGPELANAPVALVAASVRAPPEEEILPAVFFDR